MCTTADMTSWMHNCNTSHSITWPQACKLQFQFSKSKIIPCCQPTSWICQNVLLVHRIDTWLLSKKQDSKDSLLGMYMLSQKCTLLMNVVQTTAAATTLGCRSSTGPSHRKWVMSLSHPHNICSKCVLSSLGAVGTIGV